MQSYVGREIMKRRKHRTVRGLLILVAALIVLAVIAFAVTESGVTRLNHYSRLDFRLGEHIDGIDSEEDAAAYSERHYEFFSDERGSGIKLAGANTRYYLGKHLGRYCVIGVWSNDLDCSVMSITTGMSELDAKSLLLDAGYRMKGGAYNKCRAQNGNVFVELEFMRGDVVAIAAYYK